MRAMLTIVIWVIAISLIMLLSDGGHPTRHLIEGDGLIWAFFGVVVFCTTVLLVLALLVSLLCRRLGLRRTWWSIVSGVVCGAIITAYNIVMQQLHGGSIAVAGLFMLAGSSVGFAVHSRHGSESRRLTEDLASKSET